MDIKRLLLEGCRISHPYKEELNIWVGEATLSIHPGYFDKPRIIFNSPFDCGEWPLDKIDEAIEKFESIVFNPHNLQYKMCETLCELNEKGEFVEMETEAEYQKVRNIITNKIILDGTR